MRISLFSLLISRKRGTAAAFKFTVDRLPKLHMLLTKIKNITLKKEFHVWRFYVLSPFFSSSSLPKWPDLEITI